MFGSGNTIGGWLFGLNSPSELELYIEDRNNYFRCDSFQPYTLNGSSGLDNKSLKLCPFDFNPKFILINISLLVSALQSLQCPIH